MSESSENSTSESSTAERTWISRLLWWLQPKVVLPLLLLGSIFLSPFLFRASRIASVPDIGDPFDVEAFSTVNIAPADNAVTHYAVAATMLRKRPTSSPDEERKAFEQGWALTSEDLRKWLEDNQAALIEWRKGTELSRAVFAQPKDLQIDTPIRLIPEVRELNRLGRLQAERFLHEENHAAAWDWLRATVRANQQLPQHGYLLHRLIGVEMPPDTGQAIARWAAHPSVTAELLRQALADYGSDEELTPPTSDILKSEFCILRDLFLHEDQLHECLVKNGYQSLWFRPRGRFIMGEPAYSLRLFRHVYRNQLSEIDKPPRDRAPLASGTLGLYDLPPGASLPARELEQRVVSSGFARDFFPTYRDADHVMQREAARRAAVSLMLACQLYHRLHSDWPARLEDLVPEILSEPPIDPLGKSNETMRLKRDGDDLVIYSVGTNGVDDGGSIGRVGTASSNDALDQGYRLKWPPNRASSADHKTELQEKP